jgi:hypothetical protein
MLYMVKGSGLRVPASPKGSNLASSEEGPLAQSVEQRTFNPWVVGSIPTGPTDNLELHRVNAQALLSTLSKPEKVKFRIGENYAS